MWKTCLINAGFNTYSGTLVGAAGSMYSRKYFKPEEKKSVDEMISYLRIAFEEIVNNLPWMDIPTKVSNLIGLKSNIRKGFDVASCQRMKNMNYF